jgi:hypothetical protein
MLFFIDFCVRVSLCYVFFLDDIYLYFFLSFDIV